MPTTQLLRLSQGQLNLLETCPRKFQHIYLEQLSSPTNLDQQQRLNWGSNFHLLMQQRELGLPIESLIQEDEQLQRWVTALVGAAPEILTPHPNTFREAEHCRTLNFKSYLLTVIYDLLIESKNSAQIFDWKTYPQPKKRQWLENDWQTRLYLYVLAETSDYLPEEISMTYWFVQSQPEPKNSQFTYSSLIHQQTKQDLNLLLTQLDTWLENYQQGIDFPQVSDRSHHCNNCNFSVRCERSSPDKSVVSDKQLLPNIADIAEVVL